MHKPESVLENEKHELLWDFEIQMDRLISARRLDLVIINKKRTCKILHFDFTADHGVKFKENEKKEKCQEIEENVVHQSDGDTNCNCCSW